MTLAFPKARVFGTRAVAPGGDPRIGEALHADGMVFRYPNGDAWRSKRCSQFRALQRWVRGEDLRPLVDWTHKVGSNGWRVFCQYHTGIAIDGLILRPTDASPAAIAEFVDWMREQQLRVELTILADCDQLAFGHEAQKARVAAIRDAVAGKSNPFLELCNEPFKNGADVDALARELGLTVPATRRGVLMATGSNDVTGTPSLVILDYFTDHPERKPSWPGEAGKTGHFLFDGWDADAQSVGWRGAKVPIDEDEPIGCIELVGTPDFGRRDNRPEAFEDAGAGFAIGCAGGTFHSDAGVQATVPGPVTTACARAFFGAMDRFPADAPAGEYAHDGFPHHPLASVAGKPADQNADEIAARVFATRAYAVAADPGPNYRAVPQNGWRIVNQNPRGNITELAR